MVVRQNLVISCSNRSAESRMFTVNENIRQDLTSQLENIGVLRKWNTDVLIICENKNKSSSNLLSTIEIKSIPIENTWIFDNEFDQPALCSAGKKVEKTIVHYDFSSKRLYLFMIEMKSTFQSDKIPDVAEKFEHSLSMLSVFISAHFDVPIFDIKCIFPVGVCCYNFWNPNSLSATAKKPPPPDPKKTQMINTVRNKYTSGLRKIPLSIEPSVFNRTMLSVFFLENPDSNSVKNRFIVDLQTEIINKL